MYYIATVSEIQIDEYSTTAHIQLEENEDRTSPGSISSLHVIHSQVPPTTLYSAHNLQNNNEGIYSQLNINSKLVIESNS
jgi:hypothetical protein